MENLIFDKTGFTFKFIGSYQVDQLKKIVNDLSDQCWNEYTFRQTNFNEHKDTQTIPIFNSSDINGFPKKEKLFKVLEKELNEIKKIIEKQYSKEFEFKKVLLINLPAKKEIPLHRDAHIYFHKSLRFHVPILTNDFCFFLVGNDMVNMKEGQIWEISNTAFDHGVFNHGESDRIHLLIDLALKDI